MALSMKTQLLPERHPLFVLTLVFILWKGTLLLVALSSPGPGYDTSTTLLDLSDGDAQFSSGSDYISAVSKFVRWDAIYFIQTAQRGHLFEQEWAFSPGFAIDVSRTARSMFQQLLGLHLLTGLVLFQTDTATLWQIAVAGVTLSHLAHFGSVILIWSIASRLTSPTSTNKKSVASITALLYIFSPAGIFLSAPHTESVFALQSFLGLHLYVNLWAGRSLLMECIRTVLAGAIFMRATITRSNGILAGILFAIDAVDSALHTMLAGLDIAYLARLASSVAAGLLVGWGMVWPQLAPYTNYCVIPPAELRREWCSRLVPSIYTFVQSHYWQVHSSSLY